MPDGAALNAHLSEIASSVASDAHAIIVLDGAGWHGWEGLQIPSNITLLTLPAYAPELNPVENVWEYLRKNKLANRLYDDYDAIVSACCQAWNNLIAIPNTIASITRRNWAVLS
jgi:transposase